jgi:hypothetical protein
MSSRLLLDRKHRVFWLTRLHKSSIICNYIIVDLICFRQIARAPPTMEPSRAAMRFGPKGSLGVPTSSRSGLWRALRHTLIGCAVDQRPIRSPVHTMLRLSATTLVGGWLDAYTDSVPRMLEHVQAPTRAIIGPGCLHPYRPERSRPSRIAATRPSVLTLIFTPGTSKGDDLDLGAGDKRNTAPSRRRISTAPSRSASSSTEAKFSRASEYV